MFFFYRYADHRDLHSFPTRRSSDLGGDGPLAKSLSVRPPALSDLAALGRFTDQERSEEHTSELQSHVNLVCRLLLEKKKAKITPLRIRTIFSRVAKARGAAVGRSSF